MSEVKEHLLGDEHELEFEDSPTGNENTGNHDTLYDRTTNFLRSPSLARYFTIAAYVWAALCTIPALIFFIRLANHSYSDITTTTTPALSIPQIHDLDDGFSTFRKADTCNFTSLDLHQPFEPLCDTRSSLLTAMSWGGRVGFDAPYSPRGCDMRWFRPDEMCQILSRFSKIQIIGDSLMRSLATALTLLMRTDLYDGGRTSWVKDPEGADCHCAGAFQDRRCDVWHIAASTAYVHQNDPNSLYCPFEETAKVNYFVATSYPLVTDKKNELKGILKSALPEEPYETTGSKPIAYVFGHGLWNDLEVDKTYLWWEALEEGMREKSPWLFENGIPLPRLFITPTASGINKPGQFWGTQGNLAMKVFEETVGPWMQEKGVDHLGTFNASIQYNSFDGTHGGMKMGLLKAMMVLNWLNTYEF